MREFLVILLFFTIFLLIVITIYYVYISINKILKDSYNKIIYNHKNIKKEYKLCSKDCDKGKCNNDEYCGVFDLLNNKCCSFNFQCKNCISSDKKIYTDPQDINKLNNNIIDKVNIKIKEVNKKREEENKRYENGL